MNIQSKETLSTRFCTFYITITKQLKIKCSIQTEELDKIPIELREKQLEYMCNISFNKNKLSVCDDIETENTVLFIGDLLFQPTIYHKYHVKYQSKEYDIVAELLLSLIIKEFMKHIDKEYTIDATVVEIPSDSHHAMQRIKVSLENIGLSHVLFNVDQFSFDYNDQGTILREIMNGKEKFTFCEEQVNYFKSKGQFDQSLNANDEYNEELMEMIRKKRYEEKYVFGEQTNFVINDPLSFQGKDAFTYIFVNF